MKDPIKGEFDRKVAEELLNKEAQLSDQTNIPRIIDVVGETSEALCKYTEYVTDHTDCPFLIDSSNSKVRMGTLKHTEEVGLVERAIYNSIDEHIKEDEIEALKASKIESAVLLAFSTKYLMPKDRLKMLEGEEKNLIKITKQAGIKNILIDAGVLDLPSSSWSADIIYRVKDVLGYPAGCAPSNALYAWRRKKKIVSPQFEACGASIFALPIIMGADFILYGPIENADWAYPACATVDALIAYHARTLGIYPKTIIRFCKRSTYNNSSQ